MSQKKKLTLKNLRDNTKDGYIGNREDLKYLKNWYPEDEDKQRMAFIRNGFQKCFEIGNLPFGILPNADASFKYDLRLLTDLNEWNIASGSPDLVYDQIFVSILTSATEAKDVYYYWQAVRQGNNIELFQPVAFYLPPLEEHYLPFDFQSFEF